MNNLRTSKHVLLQIYRQYSKDEAFNALRNELRLSELDNGKLKSEVARLEYENKELLKRVKQLENNRILPKDEAIKTLNRSKEKALQEKNIIKKQMEVWMSKYFTLLSEMNNKHEN